MNKKKNLLKNAFEKEYAYLLDQTIGSDEYNASLRRLMDIEKQLNDPDKKGKLYRDILEGIKVGSGIVIPIIGLVWITATERDCTFTGTLRDYTKYFLPKKN